MRLHVKTKIRKNNCNYYENKLISQQSLIFLYFVIHLWQEDVSLTLISSSYCLQMFFLYQAKKLMGINSKNALSNHLLNKFMCWYNMLKPIMTCLTEKSILIFFKPKGFKKKSMTCTPMERVLIVYYSDKNSILATYVLFVSSHPPCLWLFTISLFKECSQLCVFSQSSISP